MAEKFLILGSSSFYGSNFAKLVREKGDEAICISRPEFDMDSGYFLVPDVYAFDYVVNFISKSLVVESWSDPAAWFKTNAMMFAAFVNGLRRWEIKKFVHVSTPEVYGSTPGWVDESYTDWKPSTPYAVSRAAGDMMLKAYGKAYWFPMVITRTANIYGPGQKNKLIPLALETKRKGTILPLHGDGLSVRSFIHVKDACEATYLIAKKGAVGETYHISTNKLHSMLDVVSMIKCYFAPVEERLGKDQAYKLNSDKLRALGWKDTITLEEGLCELSRLE